MPVQNHNISDALRHLLSEGRANTQEDLKNKLKEMGFEINQSKISRLLRKLSAVKTVGANGEIAYQLSKEPEPPTKSVTIEHLIIEITRNENLIVIRTSPGSASMIARILDHNAEKIASLGSVAGDDTIIVIPKSVKSIEEVLKAVKQLLFT